MGNPNLDTRPLPDLYHQLRSCLAVGDLEGLAGLFHPEAVIIPNKTLRRRIRWEDPVEGARGAQRFFATCLKAGVGSEQVWDSVVTDNAFVVRGSTDVEGQKTGTFGYYALRDGQIWRHILGHEGDVDDIAPHIDPDDLHPIFQNWAEGLAPSKLDELMKTYSRDAVSLMSAKNARGFPARGSAVGHDQIRSFLSDYLDAGAEIIELKDYVRNGDTIYMHSLMKQNGVVQESYGGIVIDGNEIAVGFGTCPLTQPF